MKKNNYTTDIFREFALWAWGKTIPTEVFKLQKFMKKSPLGKYTQKLEQTLRKGERWEKRP